MYENTLKSDIYTLCLIYIIFINILGFVLMGLDKYKSKIQTWRIPESNLFLTAIAGGSIGSIAGMYFFRHKTKHLSFVIGMPLILILEAGILLWIHFYSPFRFMII